MYAQTLKTPSWRFNANRAQLAISELLTIAETADQPNGDPTGSQDANPTTEEPPDHRQR